MKLDAADYLDFLLWRRDAYIYRLNQTESGREYLDNAWRMEQTAAGSGKPAGAAGKDRKRMKIRLKKDSIYLRCAFRLL